MSISNPSDSAPHGEPASHVMDQSDRLQSLPTEEHGHPPISTNIALDLAPPDLPQPHTVSPASLFPSNQLRRDENASEEEHAGADTNENTERPAQDGPFGSDMPPMTGDHASTTESGHRRNEAVATDSSDELPGRSLWTHFTQLLQRIHDSITHVSGDRPVVPLPEENESDTKHMINLLEPKIEQGAMIRWIHRKTERVLSRFMMSHTIQASISHHHTKRQTPGSNRKRHSKILMLHRKKHRRMKVHPTQSSTTGLPMNRHPPTCWCIYHLMHRHSLSVSCMILLHV